MAMPPRLTIAIPTLNRARLLRRALESALAQTSQEVEILVSDNGSRDETPAVIAEYAARSGVRTFRHESTLDADRHGQFLIDQARGSFFVGLSDDDFLGPDFAAEVLDLWDRHPELSFIYTGAMVHYCDIIVPSLTGPEVESSADFLLAYYAGKREVTWCACATRVEMLKRFGPMPAGFVLGDMFYWTKMAFAGPVGCIPIPLSHYVLLRPQDENDNMSHGTRPLVWSRQQQEIADGVLDASARAGAGAAYLKQLANDCRIHRARSTANQFVWTRIRGAGCWQSLTELVKCASSLSWNLLACSRHLTALLLPAGMLRFLLMRAAAQLARTRANNRKEIAMPRTAHAT